MSHQPDRSFIRAAPLAGLAILAASTIWFAWGRVSEAEFVDEWAYVSQSYFAALLDRPDDPRWLEYPAYDLPPLPKYLIATALWAGGQPIPGWGEMVKWYGDTSSRSGDHVMLAQARWPSVLLGAAGCLALMAIGTLCLDRRVGVLAAVLLAVNPLYATHARRAMSDVPTEAFTLLACAAALWGWTRLDSNWRTQWASLIAIVGSGALAGLAVLSKLSGGLAVMILLGWTGLFLAIGGGRGATSVSSRRVLRGLAAALSMVLAYRVFLALNPFLTAHPRGQPNPAARSLIEKGIIGRTFFLLEHRSDVSKRGQEAFPNDATRSLADKTAAVAVQGFGRFGLLGRKLPVPAERRRDPERQLWDHDSTVRFDPRQDLGAVVWLPLVLTGACVVFRRGRQQHAWGEPPAAWALLLQWAITLATVAAFLPLAWDRYYLPLQASSSLLASAAILALLDRLRRGRVIVLPRAIA
jgi:4-amino-4-deoxy-L-arabinose transferase-like glycosyltransferase